MKRTIISKIGILTLITTTAGISYAEVHSVKQPSQIRVGVLYDLTPQMASSLKLNLSDLQKVMRLRPNERVLFKVDEGGELNLSIYENSNFSSPKVDEVLK